MKRICLIIAIAFFVLVVIPLSVRYYRNRRDREAVGHAIAELNGNLGSIPCEPFGTEYRIYFDNRDFTRAQLDRLAVLESLSTRNYVRVMFKNTNLSEEDLAYLKKKLPNVHFTPLR